MHYIRFLKAPQLEVREPRQNPHSYSLTAKVTITNDLGDEFLFRDLPLNLTIFDRDGRKIALDGKHDMPVLWKQGSRELKVAIHGLRRNLQTVHRIPWRLSVWPSTGNITPYALRDVLKINRAPAGWNESSDSIRWQERGAVLRGLSTPFELEVLKEGLPAVIYRKFLLDNGKEMMLQEETGNSIARHLWDAGVVLSALLQELLQRTSTSPKCLQFLRSVLNRPSPINILELGTGCAVVAAAVAQCAPNARIIATDMAEAAEIASVNLGIPNSYANGSCPDELDSASTFLTTRQRVSYRVLDWSEPLPPVVAAETLDLVLVADCTYNADVVPYLVDTLARLVESSPEVLICVALKRRHESEAVFFDLMAEKGLIQVDKHVERSGKVDWREATGLDENDDSAEEIEIYLFMGAEGAAKAGSTRKSS